MIHSEILDSLPVGIAFANRSLTYRYANSRYASIINQKPDLVVGRSMKVVLPREFFDNTKQYLDQVLQGRQVEFDENLSFDCSIKKHSFIYTPIVTGSGFICIVNDEQKYNKFFKEGVQTTLATVNHYINNSLANLLSSINKAGALSANNKDISVELQKAKRSVETIVNTLKLLREFEEYELIQYSEKLSLFNLDREVKSTTK